MTDFPEPTWFLVRPVLNTATTNGGLANLANNKYVSGQARGIAVRRIYYPNYTIPDNEDMDRGRRAEAYILEEAAERLGMECRAAPLIINPFDLREAATADGQGYEAKCPRRKYDSPPTGYVVQGIKQINLWGRDFLYLVCSSAEGDRQNWKIHYSQDFYDWMMRRSRRSARYIDAGYDLRDAPHVNPSIYDDFQRLIQLSFDYDRYRATAPRWTPALPRDQLPPPLLIEVAGGGHYHDTPVAEKYTTHA